MWTFLKSLELQFSNKSFYQVEANTFSKIKYFYFIIIFQRFSVLLYLADQIPGIIRGLILINQSLIGVQAVTGVLTRGRGPATTTTGAAPAAGRSAGPGWARRLGGQPAAVGQVRPGDLSVSPVLPRALLTTRLSARGGRASSPTRRPSSWRTSTSAEP